MILSFDKKLDMEARILVSGDAVTIGNDTDVYL